MFFPVPFDFYPLENCFCDENENIFLIISTNVLISRIRTDVTVNVFHCVQKVFKHEHFFTSVFFVVVDFMRRKKFDFLFYRDRDSFFFSLIRTSYYFWQAKLHSIA